MPTVPMGRPRPVPYSSQLMQGLGMDLGGLRGPHSTPSTVQVDFLMPNSIIIQHHVSTSATLAEIKEVSLGARWWWCNSRWLWWLRWSVGRCRTVCVKFTPLKAEFNRLSSLFLQLTEIFHRNCGNVPVNIPCSARCTSSRHTTLPASVRDPRPLSSWTRPSVCRKSILSCVC